MFVFQTVVCIIIFQEDRHETMRESQGEGWQGGELIHRTVTVMIVKAGYGCVCVMVKRQRNSLVEHEWFMFHDKSFRR